MNGHVYFIQTIKRKPKNYTRFGIYLNLRYFVRYVFLTKNDHGHVHTSYNK